MKKFLFLFAVVVLAVGACKDDIVESVVPEIFSVENVAGDADAGVIKLVAHWDKALNDKITKVTYVLKDDAGKEVSKGNMTVSSDKAEAEITGLAPGSGPYWPTVVPYAGKTAGAAFTLPEDGDGFYAGGKADVPFTFAWIEQNLDPDSNGRKVKVTVGWDYEKFTDVKWIGYSAWTLDWSVNFTGDFTDIDAANGRASVVIELPEGKPYGNYILGLSVTKDDYANWVPGAGFATDAGCTPPYLQFPEPEAEPGPDPTFEFASVEQNLVPDSNGRKVTVTVAWDASVFKNVSYIGYKACDINWGNAFTGDFTDIDAAAGRASVDITLPEGNPYGNYILGLTITKGNYDAWVGGLGTDGATPPFLEFPEPEAPFAFAWIEQNLVPDSNGRQVKVTVGWDYGKFDVDYIGYSAWTLDWATNFTGDFTEYDAAAGRASVVIDLPENAPYGNYILGLTVTKGDYNTWVPGAGFATDAGCTPPYLMFPEPEVPEEPFAFTSIEQNPVEGSNGRTVKVTVGWDSNKFKDINYIGYSACDLGWGNGFTGDFTDIDAAAGRASVDITLPEGNPYGNYILGLTITKGDYNAWVGGLATDGATPPFLQFSEPEPEPEPFAFAWTEQNLVSDSNGRKVKVTVGWDYEKFNVDYIGYSAWTLDWGTNFTGDFTEYDAANGRASVVIELPEGAPYGNYILGLTVTRGDYNAWVPGAGFASDAACTPPFLMFPEPEAPEVPFTFNSIEQNLVEGSNGRTVKVTVGWDANLFKNINYIGYSAWDLGWGVNFTGDFTQVDAAAGRASVDITLPEGKPYGNYILGLTITQGDYNAWVGGLATDGATPPFLQFPEPAPEPAQFSFATIEQNLDPDSNGRTVKVTVTWDANTFKDINYIGYQAWTLDWGNTFSGDFTNIDAAAGRASVDITLPDGKPYGNYILGLTITEGNYGAWVGGLAADAGCTPPYLQFPQP